MPVHPSKHEIDKSNVVWSRITYPEVVLPGCMDSCVVARQESGLSLSIFASEQFLRHGKISVRLHYASGQSVSPDSTPAESAGVATCLGGTSWNPVWDSLVMFPWGKNILEEAWIEVATGSRRIWLEIPYGFTRDPKAPSPPPTFDGDARFASAMKHLVGHEKAIHLWQLAPFCPRPPDVSVAKAKDIILNWATVQYDSFPIQKGWRLSFTTLNIYGEPRYEVELYREDQPPWDLYSARTGLRSVENSGHVLAGRCESIRVHNAGMCRSDTYTIMGYRDEKDDRRSWEKVEVDVKDKTYSIMVPSSLLKYSHGTTSYYEVKTW